MQNDLKKLVWQRAEVSSPCVQICVIHPKEQICAGCYRTVDEITEWGHMSEGERTNLMQELPERAGRLKKRRGGRKEKAARSG
ncbi:DUF1289 domain-containing protein [Cognatishimia activa]|uniref:DUF1289 domain-containing protein n=1 Tax=Cognatishimia activa TaxID=1715691 RepID=UPI002232A7BC|nr:DUF1289 domain-containing protein [Cognatishimia activa]UZD92469.1 DUF1289 domain-containing protein [Cognatishimia activa]